MKNIVKGRLKSVFICILMLLAIIMTNIPGEVFAELPDTDFYSGKILVKTEDSVHIPEGGEVLSQGGGMYLVDYVSPSEAQKAYLAMEENPDILASPEMSFVVCSDQDIKKNIPKETQNAITTIDNTVPDYFGNNVIALIDTGANPSEVLETFSVLQDEGWDDNGHGSKMVEAIKKMDSDAKIVSIKALNKSGAGSVSSVYAAIKMAVKMRVKVINLSIVAKSVDENEIIKDAIKEALNNNIVVVGAAGNSGDSAENYIPGCINGVIVVGACNENGERLQSSNYGDNVDWNVYAKSTSAASAILSGFIAKNCETDRTLSTVISEEVGKGLIFSTDYKAVEKENNSTFPDINWKNFDLASLSEEEIEFFSKGNELNSLKLSDDGKYLCVTTTDYAVPDDGSFVPAAWEYGKISSESVLRMNGISDDSGYKESQNRVTVSSNPDGTISSQGSLLSGYDYKIVGYTFNYTPGTFEKSALASELGTVDVSPQSLKIQSRWADGLWDKTVSSGVKTYHSSNQTPLIEIVFWSDKDTCIKYLYKLNTKLYLKDLPFNERPLRESCKTNDHSIWYEEGGIYTSKSAVISTAGAAPYHAELGLSLRKYKIYYQRNSDPENLYLAGTGVVGSTFDFTSAEKLANAEKVNKSLSWNYEAFGSESRPLDSLEIMPCADTPVETDEYGEVFYKYVIKPVGSSEMGKARIEVLAKDTMKKIENARFKLVSGEAVIKEELVTNEEGELVLDDLYWAKSLDADGMDGNYTLIPLSVPEGFMLPREISIEINEEIINSSEEVRAERLLEMEDRTISLESVVLTENAPRNVFYYEIVGEDVSGTERTYSCVSSGHYERKLPAGKYTVTVMGKPGYEIQNTEYLEGFNELNEADLRGNSRGSVRFLWECGDMQNDISGDVLANRFRK